MPLQKLPTVDLDNPNHRKRARETLNGILDHSFDDSRRQTTSEKLAGITPINQAYPPGDVRRYGVTGDGSDESAKIQNAIEAMKHSGGDVVFPGGTYNLGTTGLTGRDNVMLVGDAAEVTILTYSGATFAINFEGGNNGCVDLYIKHNNQFAGGVQFGNDSRRSILRRVTIQDEYLPAADRTGTSISLFTTTAATTFSGNFLMEQVYLLGSKYGITVDCFEIPLKTWTTIVGSQVFIVGAGLSSPGVPIIPGSRGIICTANSNCVGSAIFGGTIEGHDLPMEIANGGFGFSCYIDVEGNASDVPILGATYCGEFKIHPAGKFYSAGANGTTNRWWNERNVNGEWDRETYYNHSFTLYDNGSTAFFDLYRGASRIAGGSPSLKFRVATGNSGADTAGERNYIEINGHKMTWTAGAAPATGTWTQGDFSFNASAAVGSPKGWHCTVSGTPGTWVSAGNL